MNMRFRYLTHVQHFFLVQNSVRPIDKFLRCSFLTLQAIPWKTTFPVSRSLMCKQNCVVSSNCPYRIISSLPPGRFQSIKRKSEKIAFSLEVIKKWYSHSSSPLVANKALPSVLSFSSLFWWNNKITQYTMMCSQRTMEAREEEI